MLLPEDLRPKRFQEGIHKGQANIASDVAKMSIVSVASIEKRLKIDRRKVARIKSRFHSTVYYLSHNKVKKMVETTCKYQVETKGRNLSFWPRFRLDETPLPMRVAEEEEVDQGSLELVPIVKGLHSKKALSTHKVTSVETKLVQMEFCGGMLLESAAGEFCFVDFTLPVALAVYDRNTAECNAAGIMRMRPDFTSLYHFFEIIYTMYLTDGHGGIAKGIRGVNELERDAAETEAICGPVIDDDRIDSSVDHGTCDVHHIADIAKAQAKMCPDLVTGVKNLALALRPFGELLKFRKCFRDIIDERKSYSPYGSAGAEEDAFRESVLHSYCPVTDARSALKFATLSSGANGRYKRPKTFEHFCNGCCLNETDWLAKTHLYYVRDATRDLVVVFREDHWVDADKAYNAALLLWNTHNILPDIGFLWLSRYHTKPGTVRRRPQELLAILDSEGRSERELDETSAKRLRQAKNQAKAELYIVGDTTGNLQRTKLFVKVLNLQPQLMSRQLAVAKDNWQARVDAKFAKAIMDGEITGGVRPTRASIAASGVLENKYFSDMLKLLRDPNAWGVLRPGEMTVESCAFAFMQITTAVAIAKLKLEVKHENMPFTLHRWVEEAQGNLEVFAAKFDSFDICRGCNFFQKYYRRWGPEGVQSIQAYNEAVVHRRVRRTEPLEISISPGVHFYRCAEISCAFVQT